MIMRLFTHKDKDPPSNFDEIHETEVGITNWLLWHVLIDSQTDDVNKVKTVVQEWADQTRVEIPMY